MQPVAIIRCEDCVQCCAPAMRLTNREDTMAALLERLHALAPVLTRRETEEPDVYPAANIADVQEAGLLRAPFAPERGGEGVSAAVAAEAVALLAAASPSLALLAAMPLGLAGVLEHGGAAVPEEQRRAWQQQREAVAADFRAGRIYAAANSEKGAGGSLAATKTVATRAPDGSLHLTGEKILGSFGRHADVFFSTAKVDARDLPGAGIVEFFLMPVDQPGVVVLDDWDGFGMRSTESQTVLLNDAAATGVLGFPGFLDHVQPTTYWYLLFAAIPLGCAAAVLHALATPAPASAALRLRFSEALMRYESLRAYLLETATAWHPAGDDAAYRARVLRTKTFVAQESVKLCAELFALAGGRHYRRADPVARALAGSFAGTALRPPLPLGLETLIENFGLGDLGS